MPLAIVLLSLAMMVRLVIIEDHENKVHKGYTTSFHFHLVDFIAPPTMEASVNSSKFIIPNGSQRLTGMVN